MALPTVWVALSALNTEMVGTDVMISKLDLKLMIKLQVFNNKIKTIYHLFEN